MKFLKTKNAKLAYHKISGRSPGVIFCCGYQSDMNGTKALALEKYCREQGSAFVRFDYQGHGESSGNFADGDIGVWFEDALNIFDEITEEPQIIVGSSMGGWIATLLAMKRPERVKALIGIAAAPDFTEDLMWNTFTPEQKEILLKQGVIYEENPYAPDDPTKITLKFIEKSREFLVLKKPISFNNPVRLLHGMQDKDVPWQYSQKLLEKIESPDVRLILIKDGEHRLSREQDLQLLCKTLSEFGV